MENPSSESKNNKSAISMWQLGLYMLLYLIFKAIGENMPTQYLPIYDLINIIIIVGFIDYLVFSFIAKKKKSGSKIFKVIAWSNIITWIIPILGIITSFATITFTRIIYKSNHKKFYVLATLCLVLSIGNYISFFIWHDIKFTNPFVKTYQNIENNKIPLENKLACSQKFKEITADLDQKENDYFQIENKSNIDKLLGYQIYLVGFYSPKLNSCLYAVKQISILPQGENNNQVDTFIIYDALTQQKIKGFPESDPKGYAKFIYEYSGGEIKI